MIFGLTMAEIQETVTFLVCNKCDYKWLKRFKKLPTNCANPICRSPNWNKKQYKRKPSLPAAQNIQIKMQVPPKKRPN